MIYFDNSATTRPYEEVLDAFITVNREFFGNPSSLHNFGGKAEKLITKAREQISGLLGVRPTEIYFTSGGTEANNLAIKGLALEHQGRGNHIIATSVEHASVREACRQLESLGFTTTYLPVGKDGAVSVEDIRAAITEETILVAVMHVNNEVGAVQPVQDIAQLLKSYPKIHFHVDHVQGAGKLPLDLSVIDTASFSAHKFHGLKGTGFLYVRDGIRLFPLFGGGNQERRVRSGTENTGGIVSMAKAFRLIEEERIAKGGRLREIRNNIISGLSKMENVHVHTPEKHAAPHIINFSVPGLKGEVLVHALEQEGIIVSTTSACSSKDKSASGTLIAMGVSEEEARSAIRASLSYQNTMNEAKEFLEKLDKVIRKLFSVVGREL